MKLNLGDVTDFNLFFAFGNRKKKCLLFTFAKMETFSYTLF